MKKSLKILLIFCLISFSIVLVKASTPMTWEEIRDKIWHEGDTLTAQNFDIVVQKIAEFNGLNNFLGMFDIVVDKVKEIDEKFANIFSDESGNVGIGTETPTQKLEVRGNIRAEGYIESNKIFGELVTHRFDHWLYNLNSIEIMTLALYGKTIEEQGHAYITAMTNLYSGEDNGCEKTCSFVDDRYFCAGYTFLGCAWGLRQTATTDGRNQCASDGSFVCQPEVCICTLF